MIHKQRWFPPPGYVEQVYGYGRVSHKQQFDKGNSLEDQETRINAYVGIQLSNPEGVFKYAKWNRLFLEPRAQSAYKRPLPMRPAGSELMEVIQPGDHIVVDKLDRIVRSVEDWCSFERFLIEKGISLHIVNVGSNSLNTASATGRVLMSVYVTMVQFESDIKSERVRDARARRRASGTCAGTMVPPYVAVEGLPEGKKRGSGGKRVFKPGVVEFFEQLHQMKEAGVKMHEIGEFICGQPWMNKNPKKVSLMNLCEMARKYHDFWMGWNELGRPDINTIKFMEVRENYRRKRKHERAQS